MELAAQSFNTTSQSYKLFLHFRNPGRDPLQTVSAAEKLIIEKEVAVIIGMETWGQTALVAEIGNRAQVPIVSFAEPAITPPLTPTRWPFLVTMVNNRAEQIRCTAALVGSYNWRRVIVIYEDDSIGGDTGDLALLSEVLQNIGSEIEHRLVLPSFSHLSNPKEFVQGELEKLLIRTQSRVFIVLQSSTPMTIHLFRQARKIGLVGKDTVWIITETITSLLDSFNTSVISSMEGVLGIETYFSEYTTSYRDFKTKFRTKFRSEYPEDDDSDPGIYALRAYDSIKTVIQGLDKITSDNNSLLENLLSTNFTGLSGQISFAERKLLQTSTLRIINVVGKKYNELDYFWLPEFGFSKDLVIEKGSKVVDISEEMDGAVIWPGDLNRNPKGWAMPTDAKPLKIGVPGRTAFDKFVSVKFNSNPQENKYDGFCIQLFYEILNVLDYALPYEFIPYNGTYDDLVYHVYNKTYDAIVGDVTILANRTKLVEFTQPYSESGLSMIVPVKTEESAWMFLKPFTWEMWTVTGAILFYTMLVIWFLEHQQNPEFGGPWRNQIATALWFIFSSLFFAHSERVSSNLTRLVVIVWLFVVLILNSSYTASLSSMLTVRRLKPNVTDIEWLKRTNAKVGCDPDSFVMKYLENVLEFKPENILTVDREYKYQEELKSNVIAAAFLEIPYAKVFTSEYCNQFSAITPSYRFGGLGFVFPRGSPIAADFSEAILKISENGVLKSLEEKCFAPSAGCSTNVTNNDLTESLSLHSFSGLYLISGFISTICALLFLVKLLTNYRKNQVATQGNTTASNRSFWSKAIGLGKYVLDRKERIIIQLQLVREQLMNGGTLRDGSM
ncbi:glutamate receptor 2.7-like [Pistacia vera]|uniref:glutamate receptor 2.7-like n=1 Tax=Pistacia vera TaxID=55513 RepID=UPI001262CD2A|nr:glutamate receptor 2.7-like [Pistacia vera]